jgi:hypothetical protein
MTDENKIVAILKNWLVTLQNYWVLIIKYAPRAMKFVLMYVIYSLMWGGMLTLFFDITHLWLIPVYGLITYFVIEELTEKICKIAGRTK